MTPAPGRHRRHCPIGRRRGPATDIDLHGEVPGAGAVLRQADHHQAERFQRLGHVQEAVKAAEDEEREKKGPVLFGAFADVYIDTHDEGWKNPKHRQQWRNTIHTHAEALLNIPVQDITIDDVVAVLKPI